MVEWSIEDLRVSWICHIDTFIPKNKKLERRFGFVRLSNIIDAKRAIISLNNFGIFGYHVRVETLI